MVDGIKGDIAFIDAAQEPNYANYPEDVPWYKIWPWYKFGLVIFSIGYNIWDAGKQHWGLKSLRMRRSLSNLVFDVSFAAVVIINALDMLVTVNGTYLQYGTTLGLEMNATYRQSVAVLKRVGLNFAQGLLLVNLLEQFVFFTTWYYGRKERNITYLPFLWFWTFLHFQGYRTWGSSSDLHDVSLFFRQLFTSGQGDKPYQGGGPQTVVGIA